VACKALYVATLFITFPKSTQFTKEGMSPTKLALISCSPPTKQGDYWFEKAL
jgi:hypothetical protein